DGRRVRASRGLGAREPRLRGDVAGIAGERSLVGAPSCREVATVEGDVSELDHRPRDVLRNRVIDGERVAVGPGCRRSMADELPRVRNPGVGGDTWGCEHHPVVAGERRTTAA